MPPVSFATPWRTVAAFGVAGLLTLALGVGQPPAGRLLLGIATAALLVEALRGAMLRPSLVADDDGVTVVRGIARVSVPWSQVAGVGLLDDGRGRGRGPRRRANAVEIDVGDTLLIVPAYRLDAPVADVVSAVRQRWPGAPQPSAGDSPAG